MPDYTIRFSAACRRAHGAETLSVRNHHEARLLLKAARGSRAREPW